ncbi:MAG: hypothetical protein ACFFCZ_23345 [Promethearchaeota archaeon]
MHASSTIYGMTKTIVNAGLAEIVVNPKDIAACFNSRFIMRER